MKRFSDFMFCIGIPVLMIGIISFMMGIALGITSK
jgi:hypothetical protein